MTEGEIKAIIGIVTNYFGSVTGEAAKMGTPYIKREADAVCAYTGIIGISGSRRGGVYYTADRPLLAAFGQCILGESGLDEDSLFDLVGEMTNTVAGNMRETFGSAFLISVPIVMKGKIEDISMRIRPPVFIIPLEWKGFPSHLGVGLE